jgi:pimeloyl-ACP methyl ester carboxylesterase
MIARLVRALLALELLAGLLAGAWLHLRLDCPPWSIAVATVAAPILLHGWVIGLQSLAGAWHRRVEGRLVARRGEGHSIQEASAAGASVAGTPAPAALAALRAWLGESAASIRSFVLLMPWFGERPLTSGNDRSRLPVVLVHGYFCNRAIWRPLAKRLARRGHAIESVNLEPPFASIDDYAQAIDLAVRALRARSGQSRLALVGHSMGGLAIRAWLARPDVDTEGIAAVITLGTPHQGTWSARFGLGRNAREMEPGSNWLQRLAEREPRGLRPRFTTITTRHDNIVMPASLTVLAGAHQLALEGIGHLALAQSAEVAALIEELLSHPGALS